MYIVCDSEGPLIGFTFTVEYRQVWKMVASISLSGPSEGHVFLIGTL